MLGKNLKSIREKRGLTQEKLAKEINVNRVNLAYYENGTKVPSVAVLTRIADTLDCSIDGLLGRKKFVKQNIEN
ncbi:MAG: helix-turn-helix transcriptional regulator [Oscillospiraceae bacterium]|nr:helix-turn-helix transcriptional regulator [Oscillospiraceae bacterium]